jgi:hypothetical protein
MEGVQPDVRILILRNSHYDGGLKRTEKDSFLDPRNEARCLKLSKRRQAGCAICQRYLELGSRIGGGMDMKIFAMVLSLYLGSCSLAFAQVSGGSSAGSSAGPSGTAVGSTLSNGSTISGTGGSPGPNTSNALGHGTTGNNLGAPQTGVAPGAAASHGNAVDTPAANAATQSLATPTRAS